VSSYSAATTQGRTRLARARLETASVSEQGLCGRMGECWVCCCGEVFSLARTIGPRPAPESDLAAWMARVECRFPSVFTPRSLILASSYYLQQQSLQAQSALSAGLGGMLISWYSSIRFRSPSDHPQIGAKSQCQLCFTRILRAIIVVCGSYRASVLPYTSKLYAIVSARGRS
jgi:hypothetical protein